MLSRILSRAFLVLGVTFAAPAFAADAAPGTAMQPSDKMMTNDGKAMTSDKMMKPDDKAMTKPDDKAMKK